MYGILYLCATPIGNLEDITQRALKVLREVDFIAAEDTRRTRQLLSHYGISQRLLSYHRHSPEHQADRLLELLREGKNLALVSDAGMPGISDPGEELVRRATAEGIGVIGIPGASAPITALALSGMDTRRFIFEGFLPRTRARLKQYLKELKREPRTIICFEAPHRLLATLELMQEIWGTRRIAVARELTKMFEEVIRGTMTEVRQHYIENPPRGEITLVIEGCPAGAEEEVELGAGSGTRQKALEQIRLLVDEGMNSKQAIKTAAQKWGLSSSQLYKDWLECRSMTNSAEDDGVYEK